MDRTYANGYTHRTQRSADSPGQQFFAGMEAYALSRPEQKTVLCKLGAASLIGLLSGIFWYFLSQDGGTSADTVRLCEDYLALRAYSSYPTTAAYMSFFCAWFFHHAGMLFFALLTAVTQYPTVFCALLCAVRGAMSGYAVCTLSGAFSVFTVCCTLTQGALCALLMLVCAKCVRYGTNRRRLPPDRHRQFTLPWLLGEAAPLLCGLLFALGTLLAGLLALSGICTLLLR